MPVKTDREDTTADDVSTHEYLEWAISYRGKLEDLGCLHYKARGSEW